MCSTCGCNKDHSLKVYQCRECKSISNDDNEECCGGDRSKLCSCGSGNIDGECNCKK